jgi:aryl-alcohol dehydrogenase-like predicted oxidoreductase
MGSHRRRARSDGSGIVEGGLLEGRATPEGTARFADRFGDRPGHFRRPDRLSFSSLALGLRRGDPGGVDDLLYRSAVAQCLEGGINVFNTAISDRMQTSERALGAALRRAIDEGEARRDEIVVVSKAGVLVCEPEEARSYAHAQRALRRTYVESGLVDPRHVVNGHAIDPAFLLDQIRRSRRNLGLSTIDFYLVQEPELHLRALGPDDFRERFLAALAALEEAVDRGFIGAYGVATWDGLLVPHSERGHLSIVELFEMALEVGGGHHHMLALQLPYGLAAGEGAVLESQLGPDGRTASALATLAGTGTAVLASAPLYGGRVLGRVPEFVRRALPGADTDAQRCLQFVRSTAHITCAVVGMREPDHVDEAVALTRSAPADPTVPAGLFRQAAHDGGRAA